MLSLLNALLMLVLVLNLFALATSRILTVIRTVAIQGALLGCIPLLLHSKLGPASWAAAIAAIVLKGLVFPVILTRTMRHVQIKREVEPLIGLMPSMLLGALGTVFALLATSHLPLAEEHTATLLVPASIATLIAGFIFITTRLKAVSQVIGYLVLENGIFIFGMLLVEAMPLIVEMGVLLDLFVAIFVIGIIVNQISRTFSSQDTRQLVSLKE
jgi:hydrogenase-4 component E